MVGPGVLLAAGDAGAGDAQHAFLAAVRMQDGKDAWHQRLAAPVVKGGTAVDHAGRVFACLEDGQVLCFTGGE